MKPLCLLLLLVASAGAQAQTYDFRDLDQYLAQAATRTPGGFEVLMVQNGHQIYWKQFGNWPKDQQAKIASATKWFSGAVMMSLVDDGILSLDDRASRYLPYMAGEKETITVRQLMSHTSGFGGEFPLVHPCLADSTTTLDQCARDLASVPLQAPPGTAFIYSGAGMQVSGRVAEVAAGKDWQTLFRERIAVPLGMTSTDYEYEGPTQNPRISGGGRSTASDYVKFLIMMQQRGLYEGRRVLSARAIDIMLGNQVGNAEIVDTPSPETWRYGIGNWLEDPDTGGNTLQNSSTGLAGWTPVLDRARNLQVVVGMQNAVRPFQPNYADFKRILQNVIPPATLTPLGVTNAASYEAGPVAPGELLTLFGANLGPELPVSAQIVNGSLPTTLAGTRVTFDGVAAPLLYVSEGQITAIAPSTLAGKSVVQVEVTYNGSRSPSLALPVTDSWPAVFAIDASGSGPGAVLNQDSRLNTASNPALRGSVLQFFATGGGAADPPVPDGAIQNEPGLLLGSVTVTIGGMPAAVTYAGPAPGQVSGVIQVNAIVPAGISPGTVVPARIQVGRNASLGTVTVAIQ